MDKEDLIDRLNRVYQMEEQMTGLLIDLCQPEILPSDLSVEVRKRIEGMLVSIHTDTARHKKIVLEIKESLA